MTSYQNLFVTKLPRNINDTDLAQVFAEYKPTNAKVMLDATTGKSKGFGFVLFDSVEEGSRAFEAMNHTHVNVHGHGFTLNIFPSKHDGKAASMESNALYIRNIPITMAKQSVEQFLSNFGTMVYCAMREDHHGSPVWVVYVEYDCIECAKSTLQSLHGSTSYFHDSPAPILAKFADCEEAKRERRKRREETKPQVTAGCVFPPPSNAFGGSPISRSAANSETSSTSSGHGTPVRPTPAMRVIHDTPPIPLTVPKVSMFTPMPMVDNAVIKQGKTDLSHTKSEERDPHDKSSSMGSHSWSHGSSVYRHNPYGGTPTQIRTFERVESPLERHGLPRQVSGSPLLHS